MCNNANDCLAGFCKSTGTCGKLQIGEACNGIENDCIVSFCNSLDTCGKRNFYILLAFYCSIIYQFV